MILITSNIVLPIHQNLEMEKMRLATESEKERLEEYIEYEDGTVDQPFLSPETAKEE